LFEFSELTRGQEYEITVKSSKLMVDRRHETSVTMTVTASGDDQASFTKIIVPLRNKTVKKTQG